MGSINTDGLTGESPKYDERYSKKQFKSKSEKDIIKSIVEIVKNGVDAYIEEKGAEKCDSELIDVVINRNDRSIKVINYAEGMDGKTFEKALHVGSDTGSKKDEKTGAHGYGMKEAAWSFEKSKIITFTNGLFSSRVFYWDEEDLPKYAWERDSNKLELKDRPIKEKTREETGLQKKGTYFEGILPDELKWMTFDSLLKELSWHILLRSINQSKKFNIQLTDISRGRISRKIEYLSPINIESQDKPVREGEFSFKYPTYGKISCKYKLFLSGHELNAIGDSKEAGILICSGQFSVLDCTLFDNNGRIANRIFGEALLEGPLRDISKKERIMDDRRVSGLLKNTPLYEALSKHFNPIIEKLIEEEIKKLQSTTKEIDKGVIDDKEKLLRELNKIAETEENLDTPGVIRFDPGEKGLRLCVDGNYETLVEKQPKNIYLIADPNKVPANSIITLASDKKGLLINPLSIKFAKRDIDKSGIFKRKITLSSNSIENYILTAKAIKENITDSTNIEVVADPRLNIDSSMQFVPSRQYIAEGSSKKVSLIFDKDKISKGYLELKGNNIASVQVTPSLKDAKNISNSIYELPVTVKCYGQPGNKAVIKATVGKNEADLDLEVTTAREKHLHGPFNDIKSDDQKDPAELGYFEEDTKTIKVCINHPMFKYYLNNFGAVKDGTNPFYRVLYAETVVVEALKALTRKKVKIFSNTEAEEYRAKFDEKFNSLYKKCSVTLHKFCINYRLNSLVEE